MAADNGKPGATRVQVGDIIDGRFALLKERDYDLPGVERFVARDERLRQDVIVDLITSLAPTAVRRSALASMTVRDPRIARTIAVVAPSSGGVTAVVTEAAPGTVLSEILGRRRLDEARARAVVGEAARALSAASARRVHHGWVRPQVISVDARGRVFLTGIATDGTLALQAAIRRGGGESADASALARVFLSCVTGLDADHATTSDIPGGLAEGSQALCDAALGGKPVDALAKVLDHLGTFDSRLLRGLPASVDSLPLPVALAQAETKRKRRERAAAARSSLVKTPRQGIEILPQTLERAQVEAAATGSIPLVVEPEVELEDLHDLLTFDEMVAEQHAGRRPTLPEAFWGRLNRRWPDSPRIARRLKRAHHRAIYGGPIPSTPIILLLVIGGLVAISMTAASWFAANRGEPPPPSNPLTYYPDYTFGP